MAKPIQFRVAGEELPEDVFDRVMALSALCWDTHVNELPQGQQRLLLQEARRQLIEEKRLDGLRDDVRELRSSRAATSDLAELRDDHARLVQRVQSIDELKDTQGLLLKRIDEISEAMQLFMHRDDFRRVSDELRATTAQTSTRMDGFITYRGKQVEALVALRDGDRKERDEMREQLNFQQKQLTSLAGDLGRMRCGELPINPWPERGWPKPTVGMALGQTPTDKALDDVAKDQERRRAYTATPFESDVKHRLVRIEGALDKITRMLSVHVHTE